MFPMEYIWAYDLSAPLNYSRYVNDREDEDRWVPEFKIYLKIVFAEK